MGSSADSAKPPGRLRPQLGHLRPIGRHIAVQPPRPSPRRPARSGGAAAPDRPAARRSARSGRGRRPRCPAAAPAVPLLHRFPALQSPRYTEGVQAPAIVLPSWSSVAGGMRSDPGGGAPKAAMASTRDCTCAASRLSPVSNSKASTWC